MAFDDADWGVGVEEKVNLAPTEEKGEIVIDVNSPETTTSQLRKGLNNTPTRLGFYDGNVWKSYISSTGTFKFNGDNNNYIEWNGSALNITGSISIQNPDIVRGDLNVADGATRNTGALADLDSVNTTYIDNNSITTDKIDVSSLSAITADLGIVTSGRIQNATNTNYLDMDASNSDVFLKVNDSVTINADGSGVFARALVSEPNIVASGEDTSISAINSFTHFIDTGVSVTSGWSTASTDQYIGTATIAGGISWDGGGNGYMEVSAVVGDGLRTGLAYNTPLDNRIYLKCVFQKVSGNQIQTTKLAWKLVRI